MPLEINDIDTNKLLSLIRLGRQELLNQDFIINDVVTPTIQIMTIRSILAQNVRLGTLWSDYFPKVIELFRVAPNENDAARIVETCFLTGTKQELLDCFSLILLESSHQGFYWRLHPQLRNFILKIAKIEQLNILESIILNRPENATLIPIEFTFLFTFLTKQENSNYAWIFFKRHKSQILEIMQDETILNIDQKDFVVMVFDLAIAALDCDEAKFLISKLSLNSPERQICLQKLLTLTSKYQERESKTESPIAKFVDEIKRDPKALQSLLNKVRSESQDRIFINSVDEFLRKFTDEIKPDKKVYYEVSRILAGSRDLIDLLPNLFQFFFYQSSSKLFLEPISARVWEVWNLVDPKNETEEFWSRVALLQKHLTGHTEVFDNLWIKIEGYRASKDCQTQKTHKWWSIFIESQLEHIQNAQNLPPTKKAFWAASLKLLKLDRPIDENSYFVFKDNLLANCQAMDDYYLNYFWKNKKFGAFTKSIRSPMCPNGFTNENLCRIWTSAIHCNESDLAWRTMSVLVSRVEVEPLLYESWKVSGELRSFYPINSVSRQEVALATSDLDQVNSAIINSLLTLSDKLNRIISDIFCTLRSNRFSKGNNGPIERRILEVINGLSGQKQSQNLDTNALDLNKIDADLSTLVLTPVVDSWHFANLNILFNLTCLTWHCDPIFLHSKLSGIYSQKSQYSIHQGSVTTGKIISSFNSQERVAWNQLLDLLPKCNHHLFRSEILKFSSRLALMIYPSHYLTLKFLQSKSMSLPLIRDIENFIISDHYSKFRAQKKINSKIILPAFDTILAAKSSNF